MSTVADTLCQLLLVLAVVFNSTGAETGDKSCSNDFYVMEQSVLLSTSNRFNLLKTFYPPRQPHPVLVKVNYTFGDSDNDSQIWFWSESEFYLIQPLEVFLFTSLLFSDMPYRRGELTLQLDPNCSMASEEYFQMLTTRLKLYTQSSSTGPLAGTQAISDDYIAVGVSWVEVKEDTLQSDFVKVWLHLTVAIFPIVTMILLYLCDPIQVLLGDKTWTKLDDEHSHGTVAALIQIAVIFTVYVFVLDIAGVYYTVTSEYISYDANAAFYLSTVTGLVVDLVAFVWVMVVLATSCHFDCKNFWHRIRNKKECNSSERVKKLMSTVTIAPILSFANHVHYIIIAFISDPFHAGSISIMYSVAFILFFFLFRQFYNRMVLHSNKRPKIVPRIKLCRKCLANEKFWNPSENQVSSLNRTGKSDPEVKCDCFIPGPNCHTPFNTQVLVWSLLLVGPLVMVYLGIVLVLFFSLPMTKSIEDAPSRLYTLYQGTGLIIVSLLAYNILLNPASFSIPKTLERLAKRLHLPENINYWNRLSDEEKCAKVIATLLEGHFQRAAKSNSNQTNLPSPESDTSNTECNDGNNPACTQQDAPMVAIRKGSVNWENTGWEDITDSK